MVTYLNFHSARSGPEGEGVEDVDRDDETKQTVLEVPSLCHEKLTPTPSPQDTDKGARQGKRTPI